MNHNFNTPEIIKKSKHIIQLLQLMENPATPAQKIELNSALNTSAYLTLHLNTRGNPGTYIHHLFNALETNRTIKLLDLSYCKLTPEHISSLSKVLTQNNTLTYLDLSYNPNSLHTGANLILNTQIRYLDLGWNLPADNFLKPFLASLKTNTTLKRLKLSHSEINQERAQDLVQILKINKSLLALDLSGSSFFEGDTAQQLEDILFASKKLVLLNLEDIELGANAPKKLISSILSKTEGPITPNLIVQTRHLFSQTNLSLLLTALDKHEKTIRERAYVTGCALNKALPPTVANIVAEYLDYEGEDFMAGAQAKPQPIYKDAFSTLEKGRYAAGAIGAGIILACLGLLTGILPIPLLIIGASISLLSLIIYIKPIYTDYRLKKMMSPLPAVENPTVAPPLATVIIAPSLVVTPTTSQNTEAENSNHLVGLRPSL